ncbi:alpha-mannosidase [Lachnotalea glycerini]|uniref:Alpha-mannosidase n=1 Tax=Lachnotalea glycerini TaxID=1763509 RepID=A0A371JFS7_9FIRM|nr:alpha-mannosidase [Lachnotalea glycerini]RDY31601.1 alpha-mannosidase [Lachnotalea glycerini]
MNQYKNRIQTILKSLDKLRYSNVKWVENIYVKEGDYSFAESYQANLVDYKPFLRGETWGGTDKHFWFYTVLKITKEYQNHPIIIQLNTGATDIWNTDNPQIIVYSNGNMRCAMDMNHNQIILTEEETRNQEIEFAFYAYSNSAENSNFFDLQIAACHTDVEELYYDMKVLFDAVCLLREDDIEAIKTLEKLGQCVNLLDLRDTDKQEFFASVKEADSFLKDNFYLNKSEKPEVIVHSIGHTHIDVAWKWQLKQTRQKVVRSFLTVLNLMDRYPEYKFMSSQPQLYQFVKEEAPQLYERIKEKVLEGRWETEGAMWLEADCNLASGESLIRQLLYGKRFFKEEFGVKRQEVLWLPDVFGYSVALPQIMKKSGIRYFMTTKIGWNEYNQIPNDTFYWKGLDGSEILTYFITTKDYEVYPELKRNPSFNTTYNGRQNASQIKGTWQRYQNKELNQEVLTCYGHGDGGGGPTAEMLEESKRLEYGVCGVPATRQTFAKDFFHTLEANLKGKTVPKWSGELYLEFHRGTYTSMARNKKNNRECEFLNVDAEFFSMLALMLGKNYEYPQKELEQAWRLVLLNQFHDILPGSSIKEVYEDCDQQYGLVRKLDETIIEEARRNITANLAAADEEEKLVVYNCLSFERTTIVKVDKHKEPITSLLMQESKDGEYLYLIHNAVSKGMEVFDESNAARNERVLTKSAPFGQVIESVNEKEAGLSIETKFYLIQLNKAGEFISIYDKTARREVLQATKAGNRLVVFEDRPNEYDAWNIDPYYKEKSWAIDELLECRIVENGPIQACIYIKREFLSSTIEQYIYFYGHTKRIDFKTTIDWKQQQLLLKAEFPVDIISNKATYEVQFGNVERPTHENTSWDAAKFEVCAHKWADISEYGYGVALLNDCKYGYDIHESVMRLTLIKSGIFPNPDADKEIHRFTYSLFPHEGDFRAGKVTQEAYDLNCPLSGEIVKGIKTNSYSLLRLDAENVFVDVIKQAEDNQDIIIRLYEAYKKRSVIKAESPYFTTGTIWECDCMEQPETEIAGKNGEIQFEMKPYEIKTLRIKQNR